MTTIDYLPVSCDLHSECELLALRQSTIRLTAALSSGVVEDLSCRVLDVRTCDGAEYLELQIASGERLVCRLDHVQAMHLDNGRQIFG